MNKKTVAVRVSKEALKNIRKGHPWVFENSVVSMSRKAFPGDIGVIFDKKNRFIAVGLLDPFSMIRLRILQFEKPVNIDKSWFRKKIDRALMTREEFINENTDGYRLIYGENDGLPGLIADVYNENVVMKIYSLSWIPYIDLLSDLLTEIINPCRIVLRLSRKCAEKKEFLKGLKDGVVIRGQKLSGPVVFSENGILFESDLQKGQKTGFFLDQRDNRSRVEKLAEGIRVLNVFSYSGGFSLYAARGGAAAVTAVDISPYAVEAVSRNIILNKDDKKISSCNYRNITGDAFETMENLIACGEKFEMLIIDPPSFTKAQKHRRNAFRAYKKLLELGFNLLKKEGIFVMASCSSRIDSEEFTELITGVAKKEKKKINIVKVTGHPPDHPVKIPEGRYLKCVFFRVCK